MPTILTVVGARPQFIKAAPMSRALTEAGLREIVVHTGQHFDPAMSKNFFDELGIPSPAYTLGVNSLGHGAMTGRMLERIEDVLLIEKPDLVLVYGDTNSTLAGALAAAKLRVPVAHVEAGLRSFNRGAPEEINRIIVDHVSALLFCPTRAAVANLAAEGVTSQVHAVGDVMYDATLAAIDTALARSQIMAVLGLTAGSYAVGTIHRAENTEDPGRFKKIMGWLQDAAAERPVIMPAHPRTRDLIIGQRLSLPGIRVIEPLGFLDMMALVHSAAAVFTDSGGLQKEAYFHRVPCVTLRDETEWVETIQAGWNRLWTAAAYRVRQDIPDYGRGDTARRIVEIIGRTV